MLITVFPYTHYNRGHLSYRVKTLRTAFHELQQALPCVPPNTKLSKLDVLVLATMYIAHLMGTLRQGTRHDGQRRRTEEGRGEDDMGSQVTESQQYRWCPEYFHPVKVGQ